MEINQNLTKTALVDIKSARFSTFQKVSEGMAKEEATVVMQAKHLAEAKQAEESVYHKEVDKKELAVAITKVTKQVQNVHRDLTFSIDEESGRNVVTIRDSKSREVIKQLPSEELLVLAKHLNEQLETDGKVKAINFFSSIA